MNVSFKFSNLCSKLGAASAFSIASTIKLVPLHAILVHRINHTEVRMQKNKREPWKLMVCTQYEFGNNSKGLRGDLLLLLDFHGFDPESLSFDEDLIIQDVALEFLSK